MKNQLKLPFLTKTQPLVEVWDSIPEINRSEVIARLSRLLMQAALTKNQEKKEGHHGNQERKN
jgi:hypothetical protein